MFYHNYWLKLPPSQQFMEPEAGMKLVQQGGFAYHSHPDVSYPFVERFFDFRQICELNEVHLATPAFTTFAVSLNSSFIEISRIG